MSFDFSVECKNCGKYIICMEPKEGKWHVNILTCWSYKEKPETKKSGKKEK